MNLPIIIVIKKLTMTNISRVNKVSPEKLTVQQV